MKTKLLQGALLLSLLLNVFLFSSLLKSPVAVAPEKIDCEQKDCTDQKDEVVYESGKTYPLMRVVDGDTIIVGFENATEYVRLIGIDAPEMNDRGGTECYATESTKHLQDIAETGLVILDFDETQGMKDSYGRLLAYVRLPEGIDIGEQMLKDGYAREFTYHSTYARQNTYITAEESARNEKKGLWADTACTPSE